MSVKEFVKIQLQLKAEMIFKMEKRKINCFSLIKSNNLSVEVGKSKPEEEDC